MTSYYERVSHFHCWNQNGDPACGIALEKHTQCCLCDLLPPEKATTHEIEGWEEWARTLSNSTNPKDTDLLVAKIKVLLTHQQERIIAALEKLYEGTGILGEFTYHKGITDAIEVVKDHETA